MVMRVATFFPFQTTYHVNGHNQIEQELNRAKPNATGDMPTLRGPGWDYTLGLEYRSIRLGPGAGFPARAMAGAASLARSFGLIRQTVSSASYARRLPLAPARFRIPSGKHFIRWIKVRPHA
jgi:hypothetical protein